MNLKKIVVMSGVALMLTALPALAGKSSVELGKQLFNDPSLGSSANDKSCNSCHPGGEGLEKAASLKNLSKTINLCVTGPMAGKKLDGRGVEMRSLKMYIESLGGK